jgi:flagellar basal body-associated protein FliL
MIPQPGTKKGLVKKLLIAVVALLLIGGGFAWYAFTKGFDDTATLEPDYTVNAAGFIEEFRVNGALSKEANTKYAEKIIAVSGRVSSVEAADTTLNLKIENAEGAYIAFAFQQKDQAAVQNVKAGDSVTIKGSCNGGSFSSILGVPYITFKRSSLIKLHK